jgi:hypothetical protein
MESLYPRNVIRRTINLLRRAETILRATQRVLRRGDIPNHFKLSAQIDRWLRDLNSEE